MSSSCLFYSSHLFLLNVIIFLYYDYLYSLVFLFLFISSILYHTSPNVPTRLFDKLCIALVVIYGGSMFFGKMFLLETFDTASLVLSGSIFITFLSTVYLYFYGYIFQQYCFHPDLEYANKWHSLLHILSCIGHILIAFL